MEHLEYPSAQVWEQRRVWFELAEAESRGEGSYLLSEQACALCAEIQAVFCAGAWVSVVVLSVAVVEAHLREVELPTHRGSLADLIEASGSNRELHRLRRRRNALVHANPNAAVISVEQQWGDREQLEQEARDAVRVMFSALYSSPAV